MGLSKIREPYIDHIYQIVSEAGKGMDLIDEENIIHLIGVCGLLDLKENHLIEACRVTNGRQLYTL